MGSSSLSPNQTENKYMTCKVNFSLFVVTTAPVYRLFEARVLQTLRELDEHFCLNQKLNYIVL